MVVFLGPSGCGKTTLLRIIAGLETQDTGTHRPGRPRHLAPAGHQARLRHRVPVVCAVSESHHLRQRRLRARESPPGRARRSPARVQELLKLVGLPDSGGKYPGQLSGGQQQRIALARALATAPGLLLLDEPLSALDAIERVRLRGEIRALQQRLGVTTIMVTHDQEEALSMADRIVVMNAGRIEQVGTPREIYGTPTTPFVADFVGKINVLPAVSEGGGRFRVGGVSLAARCRLAGRHRRAPVPAAGGGRRARRTARAPSHALPARGRQDRVPRRVLPRGRRARQRRCRARCRPTCRGSSPTMRGLAPGRAVGVTLPRAGDPRARLTARCDELGCRAAAGRCRRHASCRWVHWQERLAQGLLLLCCVLLAVFLLGAARRHPRQERAGQGRRLRGPAAVPRVLRHARAAALDLEHAVGRDHGHRHHGAARVHLRLCAHALAHAAARSCSA